MLTNTLKWVIANLAYNSGVLISSIDLLRFPLSVLQAVHNRWRVTFRYLIDLSLWAILSAMRMCKTWYFLWLLFPHLRCEKNLRHKKWWLNCVVLWFWFPSRISRLCVYINYSSSHRKFIDSRGGEFSSRILCLFNYTIY